MTQSRIHFNRQKLGMIDNNPSSMHREYNEFYAVRVYLRSIRISLVDFNDDKQGETWTNINFQQHYGGRKNHELIKFWRSRVLTSHSPSR